MVVRASARILRGSRSVAKVGKATLISCNSREQPTHPSRGAIWVSPAADVGRKSGRSSPADLRILARRVDPLRTHREKPHLCLDRSPAAYANGVSDSMTIEQFHLLKRKIMAQGTPGSRDDLEGMMIDFQHSLDQSRLLTRVHLKKTGDPDCMIETTCQPAAETLAISEVVAEIERLWMEELRYHQFEAHAIHRADYQEALDFITVGEHGGSYVTGRIAVDISKIQGPIKTVMLWYRLTGSGWSEAGIRDGVNHAFLTASYLSDALQDLTNAVIALLQGAEKSTCSWGEEPGEYRWVFERQDDRLQIKVLWFEDTFDDEPDERGKLTFSTVCDLRQFAGQLRGELQRLLDEHGVEEYRRSWGHDFPMTDFRELEALLAPEQSASR
jgi:hypothetical protein